MLFTKDVFKLKQSVCVLHVWFTFLCALVPRRHPTSCCSVAEIMSVLFFHTMKYRYDDPRNFNNDRFILSKVRVSHSVPLVRTGGLLFISVSNCCPEFDLELLQNDKDDIDLWLFFLPQGHAAPALYSMWVEAGFLKETELLSLCHVDSTLEGHPTPVSLHIYCPTHWE